MRGGAAVLALVCLLSGVARAQPGKEERAKTLYREGQAFFDAGKYDDAIAKWKESFLLSDEPLLLFNLGQAYRLKGECEEARVHYENYLKRGTKMHTKEAIEKTLQECEEKKNREKQEAGDRKQETGAGGNREILAPGSVTESVPVTVSQPQPQPEPEPEPGKRKKALALAVGGTGVVLTLTGVVFGVMARNDKDELEDADGEWDEDLQSLEDRRARNATLAPIFIGVGVAAVAGGAVLYWMGRREAQEASAVGAAPTADGTGGVVLYTGDF